MAKEEISRLDKVLSNNGFGTRSRVKGMLHKMCVAVNGNVVTDGKTRVNTLTDVISVDGIPLEIKKELYIMMNKSAGSVCSARSGMHLTVFSFLEDEAARRF
ncbi:MAG: rRNA pseudouridine synthase, partial [Treponema sp.]|nr:rRNA pseudouridine synthase [Treponema sp.]